MGLDQREGRFHSTSVLIHVLLRRVLILMDPFPVALEEDLQGRYGPTAQLDGVALHDVGILWFLKEVGEGAWDRRQVLWHNISSGS